MFQCNDDNVVAPEIRMFCTSRHKCIYIWVDFILIQVVEQPSRNVDVAHAAGLKACFCHYDICYKCGLIFVTYFQMVFKTLDCFNVLPYKARLMVLRNDFQFGVIHGFHKFKQFRTLPSPLKYYCTQWLPNNAFGISTGKMERWCLQERLCLAITPSHDAPSWRVTPDLSTSSNASWSTQWRSSWGTVCVPFSLYLSKMPVTWSHLGSSKMQASPLLSLDQC